MLGLVLDFGPNGHNMFDADLESYAVALHTWCINNGQGNVWLKCNSAGARYFLFEQDTDVAIYKLSCPVEEILNETYEKVICRH